MTDPRDIGISPLKDWEEFRASFAVALLQVWLAKDLPELAVEYPRALWERIQTAHDISAQLQEDDPDFDGAVPIPGPGDKPLSHEWWTSEAAELLEAQLFPHGHDGSEFQNGIRSLAAVALYAALDAYSGRVLPEVRGAIERVRRAASETTNLDADTDHVLADLNATRQVIVHNRGVVDEQYIRRTHEPKLAIGEFRLVSDMDLHRFADAVWRAAGILRAWRGQS